MIKMEKRKLITSFGNNVASLVRRNKYTGIIKFSLVVLAFSLLLAQKQVTSAADSSPRLSGFVAADFSFQRMSTAFRQTMPTQPNRWLVTSNIVNDGTTNVEVLPIYLFSEGQRVDGRVMENAKIICPESYKKALDPNASLAMIGVPADANQTVTETIAMPFSQLEEPVQGEMGAAISWMEFKRFIAVDEKPARWERIGLGPKSSLVCTWEFWSVWAAPEKIRNGKSFRVIHLGPVISCKTLTGDKAYIAIATLEAVEGSSGQSWKQTSLKWAELKPDLSEELTKAAPECPSVVPFVKDVYKAWVADLNIQEPK